MPLEGIGTCIPRIGCVQCVLISGERAGPRNRNPGHVVHLHRAMCRRRVQRKSTGTDEGTSQGNPVVNRPRGNVRSSLTACRGSQRVWRARQQTNQAHPCAHPCAHPLPCRRNLCRCFHLFSPLHMPVVHWRPEPASQRAKCEPSTWNCGSIQRPGKEFRMCTSGHKKEKSFVIENGSIPISSLFGVFSPATTNDQ
jgi:hypothetical protein